MIAKVPTNFISDTIQNVLMECISGPVGVIKYYKKNERKPVLVLIDEICIAEGNPPLMILNIRSLMSGMKRDQIVEDNIEDALQRNPTLARHIAIITDQSEIMQKYGRQT